jgi:hypothetical protein
VATEKLRPRDTGTTEGLRVAAGIGVFSVALDNAKFMGRFFKNIEESPFFIFQLGIYLLANVMIRFHRGQRNEAVKAAAS